MPRPRVAIFVDDADWHTRRLKRAFTAQGVEAVSLSLQDSGFEMAGDGHGLRLSGFADALPDGVFVRTISAGSFEQVTMRLGVLHALRELGVPVHNDARAIERCVDKSMTSFLLHKQRIPTPATWSVESMAAARRLVRAEARPERPLVLKPLFGSQGRGLRLIDGLAALPPAEEVAGVYYLQHFIRGRAPGWRDWRVFVVGGRAVAAMIRHGTHWRTNASQGARCEGVPAAGELAALATAAAAAVGADYAGVDIMQDADDGYLVLEVNSMPAWAALQRVVAVDIAGALAANLVAALRPRATVSRLRRAANRR
ncbi:MAG TPA: RimK family alpha-L-glutamate ligase [Candidatus Angelobacter sp.]|nr:RimK family alpha-L-glutamate ligase [Candidatus Angelobacter sp.]